MVGQSKACEYCVSAHWAIGEAVGLTDIEICASRVGQSDSTPTEAALRFAQQIVEPRGVVPESTIAVVRNAGFGDAKIAEIIANVARNVFTNYFNNAVAVEVDFPRAARNVFERCDRSRAFC